MLVTLPYKSRDFDMPGMKIMLDLRRAAGSGRNQYP